MNSDKNNQKDLKIERKFSISSFLSKIAKGMEPESHRTNSFKSNKNAADYYDTNVNQENIYAN